MAAMPPIVFDAVDLAIAKLDLAPGDILVAKISAVLDNETRGRIAEHLSAARADGGRVLVLDEKVELSVVKAASA